MTSGGMLEAALALVADGCAVFPCESRGKRPIVAHGLLEATRDVEIVRAWWARWPDANPAWATGAPSGGLVVVDVDTKPEKRGDVTLAALVAERGPVPWTREVETPSGGWHLVYRAPEGVEIRNSQGKVGLGIDVRGTGGYVVGEGANGPGGRYQRRQNGAPLATLDGWLLEAVRGAPASSGGALPLPAPRPYAGRYGTDLERRVERAVRYVDRIPGAVAGQGGHDQTWIVAVHLVRGLELPRLAALEVLEVFNARCVPRWSRRELEHKVDSAIGQASAAPGYLLTRGPA